MRKAIIFSCLIMTAGAANALDFDIEVPNQDNFRDISEDMAAGFSYKPLHPTEPTGVAGFDLGAVASYTPVENEEAWEALTGSDVDEIGFVGLGASKGLPFGFDVAGFYTGVPSTDARLWGAELRYAFVPGNVALPALGVRGAYTQIDGVSDFDFNTRSVDVSLSKGFGPFTPYVGAGKVWVESDPSGRFGLEEEDFNENKLFAGARLTLVPLQLIAEVDRTGDNTSFNLRLAFGL